jgi:hypothetical protein
VRLQAVPSYISLHMNLSSHVGMGTIIAELSLSYRYEKDAVCLHFVYFDILTEAEENRYRLKSKKTNCRTSHRLANEEGLVFTYKDTLCMKVRPQPNGNGGKFHASSLRPYSRPEN